MSVPCVTPNCAGRLEFVREEQGWAIFHCPACDREFHYPPWGDDEEDE